MINRFFCFLTATVLAFSAKGDFKTPDFAYPQTVITDASEVLQNSNGIKRFKALTEIVKAQSDITPDSINEISDLISKTAVDEKEPDLRGLYHLYHAAYLSANCPDSVQKITRLVYESFTDIDKWGNSPINLYSEIISAEKDYSAFFSKISDFVYAKASEILSPDNQNIIETALARTTVGSAPWAYWTCLTHHKYDELLNLYNEHKQSPAGGYLLYKLTEGYDEAKRPQIIALLKEYLKTNGQGGLVNILKSRLSSLTVPVIDIDVPEAIYKGSEFEINCISSFTSAIHLEIKKIITDGNGKESKADIRKIKIDGDKEAINDTNSVRISLPDAGNYELTCYCDEINRNNRRTIRFIVTEWLPIAITENDKSVIEVVDFKSGYPVPGINVSLKDHSARKNIITLGKTDCDGQIRYTFGNKPNSVKSGSFILSQGNARVLFNDGIWYNDWKPSGKKRTGKIMTSRPLYHAGDSLGCSAVIIEKDFNSYTSRLYSGKQINVILLDANYQGVDTAYVTTDSFGRISCSFLIPTDRLTGYYHINIMEDQDYICSSSVMVSDFKLSEFEIIEIKTNASDSAYIISGTAARYSGSVVPYAHVKLSVTEIPRFRFIQRNNEIPAILAEGETDAEGNFSIKIMKSLFPISAEGADYDCSIEIVSQNAETAFAQVCFRTGKPYRISSPSNKKEFDTAEAVFLPLYTTDMNLDFMSIDLNWILKNPETKDVVYEGSCKTDSTFVKLNWENIEAGRYLLSFEPNDTGLCNNFKYGDIWVYNTAKNIVPEGLKIVVPHNELQAPAGGFAELYFGLGADAWVYLLGEENGGPVIKMCEYSKGFHSLNVPVSDAPLQKWALVIIKNGEIFKSYITVESKKQDSKIRLIGECLRNRIMPGAPERWTLQLTDNHGNGVEGAVIASLYNDAVNSMIKQNNWKTADYVFSSPEKPMNQFYVFPDYSNIRIRLSEYRHYNYLNIATPHFIYFPENYAITAYDSKQYLSSGLMRKNMMADAGSSFAGAVNDMAVEEAAFDDAAAPEPTFDNDKFDFRDAEVLQGFWRPDLYTDSAGNTFISFTMPNSTGRWYFEAFAWTKDMFTTSLNKTLVASKPVMIETSLPRFLRQHDKVRFGATIINNTDSLLNISAMFEIFNPENDNIIKSQCYDYSINSKGQIIVYADFEVPIEFDLIGIRCKVSDGLFSDGEQALLPVLPASTIAIDSDMFYLDKENTTFTTTIDASKSKKDIIVLKYCQNPIWDAIRLLPGLYDAEPKTSSAAANSIYTALTTKYLYEKYPEIREVIALWRADSTDSFISKLEKDSDMKLTSLARTPFVGAGETQTDQMQRFAATFNKKTIENALSASINKLVSLQTDNGGFAWGPWNNKSSVSVTLNVLSALGKVTDKSAISSNAKLNNLIDRAFRFIDNNVKYINDFEYATLYSLYPGRKPSNATGQKILDKCVQDILKTWKNHGTAQKATDAFILYEQGNKAMAKEILKSISQFAIDSRYKGTLFPSINSVDSYTAILETYTTIEPDAPIIDDIRKWLILQTQYRYNIASWNQTALLNAMITSGSKWIDISTSLPVIEIDNEPVAISNVEAASGALTLRIEPSLTKRALSVGCPPKTNCAYGSLITISDTPLDEIKAVSNDMLKVEKKLMVLRDGEWKESQSFKSGEEVKIFLTIRATENLEYVQVVDERACAFEPVDQLPSRISAHTFSAYRESNDDSTNFFIDYLPKGVHKLTYSVKAAFSGTFSSGIAMIQSQFAPEITARSGASVITVLP